MAREAVCSSMHQSNGMRPLQANQARSILIGCELHRVNHPGAGAVPRRKEGRRRMRGRKGAYICPRAIPTKSSLV